MPDLANGDVANIVPPERASAVPAEYHIRHVEDPSHDLRNAGIFCALAYGALASVLPTTAGYGAPAGATYAVHLAEGFGIAGPIPAAIRDEALTLGAARCGVTAAYRVAAADWIAAEVGPVSATVTAPAVAGGAHTWEFGSAHSDAAGNLTREEALAIHFLVVEMTEAEQELAFKVAAAAPGVVPANGCSLMATRHHYVPDSVLMFLGGEKQMLAGMSAAARAIWDRAPVRNRDLMFHKATHPYPSNMAIALCKSGDMPERLRALNLGAWAVRLPYVEPEVHQARAFVAVVKQVQVFCQSAGHQVAVPRLEAALAYVVSCPWAVGAGVVMPPIPPGVMSVYVQPASRELAVSGILARAIQGAEEIVAWCVGVMLAIVDAMGENPALQSTLTARSILRIRQNNAASIAGGASAHKLFTTYSRAAAEKGTLVLVTLTDTV